MTDKYHKGRKKFNAELNKNRGKGIQELADMKVEERSTKFKSEKNRYEKILDNRKELKYKRKKAKEKKLYIGKNKHITKRAIAEVEEE